MMGSVNTAVKEWANEARQNSGAVERAASSQQHRLLLFGRLLCGLPELKGGRALALQPRRPARHRGALKEWDWDWG